MRRECRERFLRQRGLVIPTCITARTWRMCRDACQIANQRFPLKSVAGKRSRHSRCMRNPQIYIFGKRPNVQMTLLYAFWWHLPHLDSYSAVVFYHGFHLQYLDIGFCSDLMPLWPRASNLFISYCNLNICVHRKTITISTIIMRQSRQLTGVNYHSIYARAWVTESPLINISVGDISGLFKCKLGVISIKSQ